MAVIMREERLLWQILVASILLVAYGGFFVFYVPPERRDSVLKAMSDLLYIPFEFENGGTRVIYYSPEQFTPRKERQR